MDAGLRVALEKELCSDDNRFGMDGIKDYIRRCDVHRQVTSGKRVRIHYIYPRTEEAFIPPLLYVQKMAKRIGIVIAKYRPKLHLEYFILPMLTPRKFPRRMVEPKHINGGYTYVTDNKVYIYRCEEMAKVAIHEACHHLPMHVDTWPSASTRTLMQEFRVATELLPNEAIVECWARLLQCSCIATEYEIPINILYKKELEHSVAMTKRLLAHQQAHFKNGMWQETSNAFCYIVFTSVLLAHCEEFLRFSIPYDPAQLTAFIIDKFYGDTYQALLRETPAYAGDSMRMTVFGDL